jgi:hypothetical protein
MTIEEHEQLKKDISKLEKEYKEICENLVFEDIPTYMREHKAREAEAMVYHDKLAALRDLEKQFKQ